MTESYFVAVVVHHVQVHYQWIDMQKSMMKLMSSSAVIQNQLETHGKLVKHR